MSAALARFRQSPLFHAVLLGLFAMAAAGLLATADRLTEAPIARRQAEDRAASLAQVVPPALHDNDLLADRVTIDGRNVYRARQAGTVVAVAFPVTGIGYGGAIDIIMGVDPDGAILGVRVLSHAETPGLGDKIETAKSDWIRGFDGLSLGHPPADEWAVKKDGGRFDQFSGATITPRAVVRAVKQGLLFFADHRSALLKETGS